MVMLDNQLKGNWAEQYISSRLAENGCLIRHVPQGHDIGIDLYCEIIVENTPFLHFWCQIKTRNRWKGNEKRVTFHLEEREKEYYIKQPVPVFVFLVPDLRKDTGKIFVPFFICRTDAWINGRIYSCKKIESSQDLTNFLTTDLPYLYYFWELKEGKVSHLKTVRNQYTRSFPSFTTQPYEGVLLTSLRSTLWRLSNDTMFPNEASVDNFKKCISENVEERVEKAEPYVRAYQIIADIQNYSSGHYEVPAIMGLFNELKGEYEKALRYYEQSLSIIERDKIIDTSQGPWKIIKEDVQDDIRRTKEKIARMNS
ncbi:MAG TPA: DUF4365 domain-containing protein [Candidatus Acidoferrales bacterium]|nr:DUF4365 domain-containing protein [Candidatus Acidoferrales bacterium]